MWYWWLMTGCCLAIPITMSVSGLLMLKHPPRSINPYFGYRTARSMQSPEAWRLAHKYCGALWLRAGLISLIPSLLLMLPVYGRGDGLVGGVSIALLVLQLILLAASTVPVELMLKRELEREK